MHLTYFQFPCWWCIRKSTCKCVWEVKDFFFSKLNILLKMWHNLRKNVSNSFYLYFHNINFLEIQHLAFKYLFDKNGILSRKRYRCLHTLFWQISDMTMEWLIRFILTSTSLEYCKQDLEVHVVRRSKLLKVTKQFEIIQDNNN